MKSPTSTPVDYVIADINDTYPLPRNDYEAINQIIFAYKEQMGEPLDKNQINALGEYYREIVAQGKPAYYWIIEALFKTARKANVDKRCFSYMMGILKKWRTEGYGAMPSKDEREVLDYFREVIGFNDLSGDAIRYIRSLIAKFGAVRVTRMVTDLDKPGNMSFALSLLLGSLLKKKYGGAEEDEDIEDFVPSIEYLQVMPRMIEAASASIAEVTQHKKDARIGSENKRNPDQLKNEALMIEMILEETKKPMKPKHIIMKLAELMPEYIPPKGLHNVGSKMKTYMKYSGKIEKTASNEYKLKDAKNTP